jgi:hypothetical protein
MVYYFYILQTMQSYLPQRTFYVYNENERSLERKINAGVPRGSILGPVLFNLYINNIPSRDNTCLAAYADDTAVLSTSTSVKLAMRNLQHHADELANWCDKWRLKININKCEHINFTRRSIRYATEQEITFFGSQVPTVSSAKYLGVHLDKKLT